MMNIQQILCRILALSILISFFACEQEDLHVKIRPIHINFKIPQQIYNNHKPSINDTIQVDIYNKSIVFDDYIVESTNIRTQCTRSWEQDINQSFCRVINGVYSFSVYNKNDSISPHLNFFVNADTTISTHNNTSIELFNTNTSLIAVHKSKNVQNVTINAHNELPIHKHGLRKYSYAFVSIGKQVTVQITDDNNTIHSIILNKDKIHLNESIFIELIEISDGSYSVIIGDDHYIPINPSENIELK